MSVHKNTVIGLPAKSNLPVSRLLALTVAGFLAIMTETMPAGLLPQISQSIGISETMAGQFITVYALGSVLAAIPVISMTRDWNRRPLFLFAIGGLLVFNTVTALSTHYGLTLAARFIAGMAAGVIWGLLAGYARRMVSPNFQGRALAIAGVGQPIALSIGVPLGTWLGTLFNWRGIFWIMSVLALLLFIWVRFWLPDFAGQTGKKQLPIKRIVMISGIRSVLLVLFAWILAHNILYTYIASYLGSVGLGHRVDAVLLLFGMASILGIGITGLLIDRWLRKLIFLNLALFAITALILCFSQGSTAIVLICIAVWGLTFGGAPTLLQTALAESAGDDADVAQSLFVTVFNLAVAGGGATGGVLLERLGTTSFAWVMTFLAMFALVIVWSAKLHGFRFGGQATSR